MKHITYGDKSLLLGDDAADVILEYAAALAQASSGDTVTVAAISSDGDAVEASFLLGAGTTMMAETASSALPEPDNADVVREIRKAIAGLSARSTAQLDDNETLLSYGDTGTTGEAPGPA